MTLSILASLDAGVIAAFALLALSGMAAMAGMTRMALHHNDSPRRKSC